MRKLAEKRRVKERKIESYTHRAEQTSVQEPDTAPGPYYVSIQRDGKAVALSGPYDLHKDAIAAVEACRSLAIRHDSFAHFDHFGTVRMKSDYTTPGALQAWGYPLIRGGEPLPETPEKMKG